MILATMVLATMVSATTVSLTVVSAKAVSVAGDNGFSDNGFSGIGFSGCCLSRIRKYRLLNFLWSHYRLTNLAAKRSEHLYLAFGHIHSQKNVPRVRVFQVLPTPNGTVQKPNAIPQRQASIPTSPLDLALHNLNAIIIRSDFSVGLHHLQASQQVPFTTHLPSKLPFL